MYEGAAKDSVSAKPNQATRALEASRRGVSPLVGVLLLVGITAALATIVVLSASTWTVEPTPITAAFELTVDGDHSAITIAHIAGDAIDVTELSVTIAVGETELAKQPPVPFVGASGFLGTPHGPFNARSDPIWTPGEQTGVTVAGTNDPQIDPGDSVTVTLAVDGQPVATLEATAT